MKRKGMCFNLDHNGEQAKQVAVMKNKFASIDLFAILHEFTPLIGMRVTNVYDIDSRTYLLKLQRPEQKAIILFESGARIHRTTHDWPKSQIPSQFSMKFRKHINQKRLISINQLGVDRIVDMQFGEEERACHVIVELYDRGNIVLTDNNYMILNILRPRTDKDTDVRFSVRERYPLESARKTAYLPSAETIAMFLANAKKGEVLRKALIKHVPFSSALLDHVLITVGLAADVKVGVGIDGSPESVEKVKKALNLAEEIQESIRNSPAKGYITYQTHRLSDGTLAEKYEEYHPYKFEQFVSPNSKYSIHEFETFSEAVDKYYTLVEEQKMEIRAMEAEKQVLKKLDNVKRDHESRLKQLEDVQHLKRLKGERVELNRALVDQVLLLIRSAVASQLSWDKIQEWVAAIKEKGLPAAENIVRLDLASNEVTLRLYDPYDADADPIDVPVDIELSAAQNCRRFFTDKKNAAEKEKKTIAASSMALKNAQMQTMTKITNVRAHTNLLRARKTMWFEKFYWFISSDKYIVIAGRDAQQNEQVVKRYLRPGDVYVHADIHGACSVVIRNRNKGAEIPPRTINEAGTMAISYSSAWEAKVVINAWWVYHHQVSRTAPTGEYLPAGSFMIRGKKNYIPSSQLQLGFGLLFRLDEESAANHKALEESQSGTLTNQTSVVEENMVQEENDEELNLDEANESASDAEEELGDEESEKNGNQIDDSFPDVQVNLQPAPITQNAGNDTEYTLINFAPNQTRKVDQRQKYLEEKKKQEEAAMEERKNAKQKKGNQPLTKRQKHKLDKIKKKYRDQDDEEREYRMRLLGILKPEEPKTVPAPSGQSTKPKAEKPEQTQERQPEMEEEDDDVGAMEMQSNEDELVISQLCSRPLEDDGLVYVVAVCAPYTAMQKFKYKVKITPGTGKRGKATKTAMQLFLHDKTASTAEQNLMKGLASDDHIAANLPGKVRVSAPQLLTMKKK